MQILAAYVETLLFFAVVDTLWLGFVARDYYRGALGDLLATSFNLWTVLAFYLVYRAGILIFAVLPAMRADSLLTAMG